MDIAKYRNRVDEIPYGKRLPSAHYVYRTGDSDFGGELNALVARLTEAFGIDGAFNVVKFGLHTPKISFLSYPDFFEDAHPALRHGISIDLVTGKGRRTDYAGNANPPILHRKESLLILGHPSRPGFEALTRAEEAAGLYENTATIGFKLNWEKLLEAKGLEIRGHSLIQREKAQLPKTLLPQAFVDRHKTALTRYELSKPVKSLLEYGLLKSGMTFFDYGCGQGSDIRGLKALGYTAEGWDPVHRRETRKREADVVNLGYVLNVIENPAERLEALVDACRHARRLLAVSALIHETVDTRRAQALHDGIVTRRNTFQKYFEQQELHQYIEDALDATAVPVGLGVFYVFRDPQEEQDFLSARSRRTIDWSQLSARLGLGEPTRDLWQALYRQHQDLLDRFGSVALGLGRLPSEIEFDRLAELSQKLGSPKRALKAFIQGANPNGLMWEEVRRRFGLERRSIPTWQRTYEAHTELLAAFWNQTLTLGRTPAPEEFARHTDLCIAAGSTKRALRILLKRGGMELLRQAAEARRNDLLVYLAMANLRKRVAFGHLSPSLRLDVRSFFGNYKRALEKGVELLYAAGDPGEIELACEDLKIGWQDEQALYVHRSLLDELPPVLRAYVGCATALFGDAAQADVVKLHKSSGKVTFLMYDDFERKALPKLQQRIKVNLRTRWVQVFDHSAERQLLHLKERFAAVN
jgi:hypothetical protein